MKISRRGKTRAGEGRDSNGPGHQNKMPSLTIEEQSALFSACYAYSPDGMAYIDKDFVIRYANRMFAEQMRVPLAQMIGRSAREVIPNWLEQVEDTYRKVRETGKSFQAEALPLVFTARPERHVTYWSGSVSPVYGSDGVFLGYLLIQREVTERIRAEEALRQSETNYRAIFDAAYDAIFVLDLKTGRILDVNRKATEMYGYTPEEARHLTVEDLSAGVPPYTEKQAMQWLRKAAEEGPQVFEWLAKDKAGRQFLVEVNMKRASIGGKDRLIAVVRDVTGRKKAEEERVRLANYLRLLLDSTDEGIYGIDLEAQCILVNKSGADMVGYKPEDLLGNNMHRLIHHSHPDGSPYPVEECPVVRAIRDGQGVRVDTDVFWRRDGTSFPVEYSSYPIFENGVVKGAVVTFVDITQRKRMENTLRKARDELERRVQDRTAELARANERLLEVNQQLAVASVRAGEQAEMAQRRSNEIQAVLDSIADGVFVSDKEGRIVEVNEAGLKMLGLASKEEALRPEVDFLELLDLRHPDGRPIAGEELVLSRALRGETVRDFEQVARDVSTRRDVYFLISAAPLPDPEGRIVGAVAALTDITRIRELDKLKDDFIFVAAHELKTPVAIMKGYAQALLRGPDSVAAPRRKMLDSINRGADRIDRIVKDLLDISQLHLGHLELSRERINLPELVEDVANRMALTTTKHRIRVVRAEPVVVEGDRYRLEQVLANLIDNAVKYSPKGGDIDVAVDVRDHEAVVSVRDYGIGIPEVKQEHIFERFYSAHTGTPYDYGGMGVGLFISREIVTRHGGRVWFESKEGKGSTFYFSLPLQRG